MRVSEQGSVSTQPHSRTYRPSVRGVGLAFRPEEGEEEGRRDCRHRGEEEGLCHDGDRGRNEKSITIQCFVFFLPFTSSLFLAIPGRETLPPTAGAGGGGGLARPPGGGGGGAPRLPVDGAEDVRVEVWDEQKEKGKKEKRNMPGGGGGGAAGEDSWGCGGGGARFAGGGGGGASLRVVSVTLGFFTASIPPCDSTNFITKAAVSLSSSWSLLMPCLCEER